MRLSGLSAFQIRWYDRLGLLGDVERAEGGWRLFSVEQVDVLVKIREWRRDGLSLREIAALLRRDGNAVAAATARRRGELARLVRIVETLEEASAQLGAWSQRTGQTVEAPSALRSIEDDRTLAYSQSPPAERLLTTDNRSR